MTENAKVALVTGSAKGIGAAICRRLAAARYALLATDVLAAELNQLVDSLKGSGAPVAALAADLNDAFAGRVLVEEAVRRWGRLDVLVNNAGIAPVKPFLDHDPEDLQSALAVNLVAPFHLLQEAGRRMRDQALGGALVNITSVNSILGVGGTSAYSASKGGLASLTRTVAIELAPYGIRCNAVAPGPTITDKLLALSEEQLAARTSRVPLGRLGSPEQIAACVAYLVSADAAHVTGQVIYVDGGSTVFGTF